MNPGWVKGWGVIRSAPWHFAGLFLSKEEADALRNKLGADYRVANGSHRIGSDDFLSDG